MGQNKIKEPNSRQRKYEKFNAIFFMSSDVQSRAANTASPSDRSSAGLLALDRRGLPLQMHPASVRLAWAYVG